MIYTLFLLLTVVPSGPPRNLATTDVTSRSISLTWDPPTAANQNGIIRTYIINMTVLESGENIQLMSNSTEIDFVMLHPYYTYTFVISAVTIGPGPPSSAYNVITAEEGNVHLCLAALINNPHYSNTTNRGKQANFFLFHTTTGTSLLTVQLVATLLLA